MIAVTVVTSVVSVSLSSCKSDGDYNIVKDKAFLADSMINDAYERGFTHEQLTALADSLYEAGDISVWKKAIVEYSVAEDNVDVQKAVDILKAAVVAGEPQTERDTVSYFFCVTHLAYSLAYQERYEEALRTATDALERVKQISNIYYRNDLLSNLYETITNAQAAMRMMDEAEQTAEEAYTYSMDAYRAMPNAPSVIATMSHVSSAITRLQDDEKYDRKVAGTIRLTRSHTGHAGRCRPGMEGHAPGDELSVACEERHGSEASRNSGEGLSEIPDDGLREDPPG